MPYTEPPPHLKLLLRDRLLWDTIQAFQSLDCRNWLPIEAILPELLKMRQWARYRNPASGRVLTAHTVVQFLRDMEVAPERRNWCDGKKHSGYYYDDLVECWKSWDFTQEFTDGQSGAAEKT